MSCIFFFFLMFSSYQLFVLVVLFVCLQWHTVGAEIKVPLCWEPRAVKFSPFKAWSRSKYSYACFSDCQEGFHSSVWYLSSQSIYHVFQNCFTFFKKCRTISGQWQIMKSRLQTWSKHCRLIACASAFNSQLVWLWVKMCHKWVKKRIFIYLFLKLFLKQLLFSV